jgi:malate synthase
MANYREIGHLQVDEALLQFLQKEALPGTGLDEKAFWNGLEKLIEELTPENQKLLAKREKLQRELDQFHSENRDGFSFEAYKQFLLNIGYLQPETGEFQISTKNVDDEIALQAGPQLVVPVNNSRYSINAANARWGSLYDALYGTDAISDEDGAERSGGYNPVRGYKVIEFAKGFLDQAAALDGASHKEAVRYSVKEGSLVITLKDGSSSKLKNPEAFAGYRGEKDLPDAVLLKHHGLHFEIQIERDSDIGKSDPAGVKDILMEAAVTVIMDCEDSVAAVDAEDKVLVYRNWLGLMKGELSADFSKGGKNITRKLNGVRHYCDPEGNPFSLPGRSLLFVRNVGHLMTNPAVLDKEGNEVHEGILDAVFTSLAGKHSLLQKEDPSNSRKGSIYIVKPKMHGPEEAAFAGKLFDRTEDLLGLERNTLKIGLMDEERRTSLNLKGCIKAVKDRIVFINTGFLDRTGDEIHSSMEAGPMVRKGEMKKANWLQAYEASNVSAGLSAGFSGRAQIGKGMWAMPDKMKEMLEQKGAQLMTGANTAWVPSPSAAVLHALHYHQINVKEIQQKGLQRQAQYRDEMLSIPVKSHRLWSPEDIQEEIENNAQGILGYVVRWVEQGIGCSKVLDIHDVGLMEDRATLRISSQHLANWIHHTIASEKQVMNALQKMARIVDAQNENEPGYKRMSDDFSTSVAFQAACELIFEGRNQPNGYTEPILHKRRLEAKSKQAVRQ